MRERRFFFMSFVTGFLIISAFFWLEGEKREILNIGHTIPAMKYLTRDGLRILAADSSRLLVVVYFNRKCEHCVYQLDLLDKNINLFADKKFIFLTSELKFLAEGSERQWGQLSIQQNCSFGVVYSNEFLKAFGTITTPSIYIFKNQGILLFKFNGEIKIEKFKQILGITD